MPRPYIIYSLSKDRTTQRFKSNKLEQIFEDIDMFFNNYTNVKIIKPDSLTITAYSGEMEFTDIQNTIIRTTTEKFGISKKSPLSYHYPSGEPDTTNKHVWHIPIEQLQEALDYIKESSPMPKTTFGPIELFISYSFKLSDIKENPEYVNPEYTSIFCIWISRNKAISPTIFFPFENADKKFWDYLDTIIDKLPFILEEKYLRVANINTKGEVKSFKKITRSAI